MNLDKQTKTASGMKVIPSGERKCIWMDAGVVSYKLCTNQFQCNTCEFDRALSNRARQNKVEAKDYKPMPGHKKEIVEWMEEFRHLSADQRKCRYMLMGEVSYKICPNSFRCGECSFDQMMQDRIQPHFQQDLETLPMVAGFYISDNLYYFRNHSWLRLERNGQYRIGMDDFSGRLIGEPSGVVLPPIGKELDMEEYGWSIRHHFGDLEFVSPIKGVVTSTNQSLAEDAARLTEQPYADGWLMTVEPRSIARSNRNFLMGDEARAWMVEEAGLLAGSLQSEAGVTMHDGAVLKKDISKMLSKEKWHEIVKNHLYVK
jgi:glycine cleavage system H lipoate-binding protein